MYYGHLQGCDNNCNYCDNHKSCEEFILINKYVEYKRKIDLQIIEKLNLSVAPEKLEDRQQNLRSELNKILNDGLDIGTIMKCVIKVKIIEYKDDYYFKDINTEKMYLIDKFIK